MAHSSNIKGAWVENKGALRKSKGKNTEWERSLLTFIYQVRSIFPEDDTARTCFHLPLIGDNKSALQSLSTVEANKGFMAFKRFVVVHIFQKFVVCGEKG